MEKGSVELKTHYLSQFYIQICHDLLENNSKIGFVFSDLFRVDEFDNKIKIISRKKNKNLLAYGAGIVIRKKIVSIIGNYDKHFITLIIYIRKCPGISIIHFETPCN